MTTPFIDRTISVRQLLKCAAVLSGIALPIYIVAVFWIAWENKMGYVLLKTSPYAASIPKDCERFADRHRAIGGTSKDEWLLNRRGIRLNQKYLAPEYGGIRCLGYAVLTGLHAEQPRLADFSDMYVDSDGRPIVTIRVTYHRTHRPGADTKVAK